MARTSSLQRKWNQDVTPLSPIPLTVKESSPSNSSNTLSNLPNPTTDLWQCYYEQTLIMQSLGLTYSALMMRSLERLFFSVASFGSRPKEYEPNPVRIMRGSIGS